MFDLPPNGSIPNLFKIPDNRIDEVFENAETPRSVLKGIEDQIAEVESDPTDPGEENGGNGGDGDGGDGDNDSADGNGRGVLRQTASDVVQISILLTGIIIAGASTLEEAGTQNPVEFGIAIGFGGLLLLLSIPLAAHVIIRTSVNPVNDKNEDSSNHPNIWLSKVITAAVAFTVVGVILIAVDAGLQIALGLDLVSRITIYGIFEFLLVLSEFAIIYLVTYSPIMDDESEPPPLS